MKAIVAITGASGIQYGVGLLSALRDAKVEISLILSEGSKVTMKQETNLKPQQLQRLADYNYTEDDMTAPMASGSARYDAMVIAPCSVKTLSSIATAYESNLITRAAMVQLKERKRLLLLIRETPLSVIHIEAMLRVAQAGAIVMPASPGFYSRPKSIDDIVKFMVGRMMDELDLPNELFSRWKGTTTAYRD
ncbi:MAG: UbiX family flavin prenyltransferase [Nitrososphaerota archaeon]|jgi:polyprenyl P-hydroxybenzoate/phenylacrylic acid decarboxylase-like protein|nr:UbiX family flavin prenyltransferase [Nitrososphaerota archaeon]MDG7036157.1 UbiX family flavin prenyltransferase [Nitrososphaerota archaeon]MDG7037779.1 UbiX family flavin prenyltransferase [Nitrososphaerota archaeon]